MCLYKSAINLTSLVFSSLRQGKWMYIFQVYFGVRSGEVGQNCITLQHLYFGIWNIALNFSKGMERSLPYLGCLPNECPWRKHAQHPRSVGVPASKVSSMHDAWLSAPALVSVVVILPCVPMPCRLGLLACVHRFIYLLNRQHSADEDLFLEATNWQTLGWLPGAERGGTSFCKEMNYEKCSQDRWTLNAFLHQSG